MAHGGKTCVDFDKDAEHVSYSTAESLLRIWETATARLKNEYLPSAHLSATCTCLRWKPKSDSSTSSVTVPKKAKKSKGADHSSLKHSTHDVIALGSLNGSINLYNVAKAEIQCSLDGVHNSAVNDVCWSDDGSNLFSCSADGLIVQWDVTTAKCVRKWSSKTGVNCLSLCGPNHIVSAGRSISIWNLETQSEEKRFTGHSTDVIKLYTVYPTNNDDLSKSYIVSVAHDDRVISVWVPSSKAFSSKRSKASFILTTEPQNCSIFHNEDFGSLQLSVLTTDGSVEIFDHQLNGNLKKPIKPKCCLRVSTGSGRSLPVLACYSKAAGQLVVMYGAAVCPAFDVINLDDYAEYDIKLIREDPSQSQVVSQVTSSGNVKQPKIDNEVTTLTPAVEGNTKIGTKKSKNKAAVGGKRTRDEPEMSIEERLAKLKGDDVATHASGPIESLTAILTQALQSNDTAMLNKTIKTNDIKVINTTVRQLSPTQVMPLIIHLTNCLEEFGSRGQGEAAVHTSLIKWIKALLHIHASFLATFPELMDRLRGMYTIMENRVGQIGSYTRLQGRLELMLSQVARQKEDDKDTVSSAALLTLQDESSEDEMMQDIDMLGVNSESEDGYLSADEDDLLK